MKRLLASSFVVLLLAACSAKSNAITYHLAFNVDNADRQKELILGSLRVVERRLNALNEKLVDNEIIVGKGDGALKLTLSNALVGDVLTKQLQEPFSIEFMRQAAASEKPDVTVEGHGGFVKTGIDGQYVDWVLASEDKTPGKGDVKMTFTKEGHDRLAALFHEQIGKDIGLFVRGKLVSKLTIKEEMKEAIEMSDIPSLQLAQVFADDVNVGLHVVFTVQQ